MEDEYNEEWGTYEQGKVGDIITDQACKRPGKSHGEFSFKVMEISKCVVKNRKF